MFIRKRVNKSGSKSIQIVSKKDGKLTIIKHIGTSSNEEELEYLSSIAEEKINLIKGQLTFKEVAPQSNLGKWLQRLSKPLTTRVGYHEVFGKMFDEIGYQDLINNPLLKDLVIARIAKPESKLSTFKWLKTKLHKDIKKDDIYLFMDTLDKEKEQLISDHTYHFVEKILKEKIHVIFFDATTLHFETFETDSFRKPGFSKVGKHNQPQIVIGLMVTKEGLPIGYDVYPGNQFDGHTIRSALARVSRRYDVERVVFIADSGMMSKENIELIEKSKFEFIMAARIKNMSDYFTKKILNPLNYKDNLLEIEYSKEHRLIVGYSENRARKDAVDREKEVERLKKKLTKKAKVTKSKLGKLKFLQVDGEAEVSINYLAVRDDAKWDGLKGYMTNINDKDLNASDVVEQYTKLWQIEKAFRLSKNELKIRPIYHRDRDRIRAHILLVFMSLVVARYTEFKLKDLRVTTKQLIDSLDNVQTIEIEDSKSKMKIYLRPELGGFNTKIYELLNIDISTEVQFNVL